MKYMVLLLTSDWLYYVSVVFVTASAPVLSPVNFNPEHTVKVNSTVNMTAQVTINNSPLTSGPTWSRINAELSKDSHTRDYSVDGNNYTTLIIDKASYSNDSGTYYLNATNQCGSSTIYTNLNIYKGTQNQHLNTHKMTSIWVLM